ncbi:MAG TPA: biopolymer transporter ExbD [Cycloclasticus sp.]|jgi:biopolymer transport protein ExbD|nr:biopolymer transporter ExbD [Cycloclasticus sp.]HIL91384.1 biopolymer transporter ExbD [Cycloclasticus sp.]
MNFKKKQNEEFDLNLTPLIDVVFLLLIFFMVTTTFDRETQLKIELPQASGETKKALDVLEISIDSKSRFYINEQEVVNSGLDTIKKALKQAAGDKQNPPLLISADGQATHQSVITVLDAASQLGFVNITFAANEPTPKTSK